MYWIDYDPFDNKDYALLYCNDTLICVGSLAEIVNLHRLLGSFES